MKKYLIIIEKTESGYSSYAPDLPGCAASGRTKEEVEENMYEAIKFHLEGMKEEGLDIPSANSESEMIVLNI